MLATKTTDSLLQSRNPLISITCQAEICTMFCTLIPNNLPVPWTSTTTMIKNSFSSQSVYLASSCVLWSFACSSLCKRSLTSYQRARSLTQTSPCYWGRSASSSSVCAGVSHGGLLLGLAPTTKPTLETLSRNELQISPTSSTATFS